ncbi:exopolyphosphatase [Brevibacterium luteolum]|uniref:Ppx/GppA phosphatase family protein n=1 Tax=Brevibacterium luteolum TaxID=199591 RepID=UPI0038796CA2
MTRVAAIDCGTNSIRLLIADITAPADGGPLQVSDVVREMRIVRLGQGVDATGRFASEALERTFAACEEYAELIRTHEPEHVRFVATSASRDAANREEFFAGVRERLGVEAEVITGIEEAQLSFTGATVGVQAAADPAPAGPFLVMDLGGGSTELVTGSVTASGAELTGAHSMDIGCVRLTERHLNSDPPTDAEITATISDIDAAYEAARTDVDVSSVRTVIGVAGTITTVTAALLGLETYEPEAIHAARLAPDQLQATCHDLLHMPRAERAALPFMHPGRVDVIGSGALIFARLIGRITADAQQPPAIFASETDILDGIAIGLFQRAGT